MFCEQCGFGLYTTRQDAIERFIATLAALPERDNEEVQQNAMAACGLTYLFDSEKEYIVNEVNKRI